MTPAGRTLARLLKDEPNAWGVLQPESLPPRPGTIARTLQHDPSGFQVSIFIGWGHWEVRTAPADVLNWADRAVLYQLARRIAFYTEANEVENLKRTIANYSPTR